MVKFSVRKNKTDSFFLFFTVLDFQCHIFLFAKRLPVSKLKHKLRNRIYIVLCLISTFSKKQTVFYKSFLNAVY